MMARAQVTDHEQIDDSASKPPPENNVMFGEYKTMTEESWINYVDQREEEP
jgi:hypothetical protein